MTPLPLRPLAAIAVAAAVAACSRAAPPAPTSAAGDGHAHAAGDAHGQAHAQALCAHRVPADLCTRCNPDLAAVFQDQGDWCEAHGVPESQCLACDPGLTFAAPAPPEDWCKEHAVPESRCTRCNPRLVARYVEAGDYCREHGFPESICPICHPERIPEGKAPPAFPEPGLRVRLASAETARDAGIATRAAEPRRIARVLEVVGQLDFDRNRLAELAARGEALVLEVRVDVGDEVKAGQPLAVLVSAAVGEDRARLAAARARLDAARSALSREEDLARSGLAARRSVEEARRELAAAQGDQDAARSALGAAGAAADGGGRHVLRAPFAGTVVARDAVPGRTASDGQVLLQVADLSTMWAQLEIPEADAAGVRPGMPVRISFEGTGVAPREAKVSRVAASVDPSSRTVRARVELPNRDRALKAGVLVRGELRVTADHDALVVPRDAVQRAEGRALVFVRRGEGLYEPVAVRTGEARGDAVEIVSGLEPGAEVVTTGAFLLKTEIMKDSIGAGCCDLEEKR